MVSSLDDGIYQDSSLSDWIAKVPRHVLGNNLNVTESVVAQFPKQKVVIAGGA
jgi:oxalate decarboxylase